MVSTQQSILIDCNVIVELQQCTGFTFDNGASPVSRDEGVVLVVFMHQLELWHDFSLKLTGLAQLLFVHSSTMTRHTLIIDPAWSFGGADH